MQPFPYVGGQLTAEGVAVASVAASVGTPFSLYSAAALTQHYQSISRALSPLSHHIFFAVKALSNITVLQLLGDLGAGMDAVSAGELCARGLPECRKVGSSFPASERPGKKCVWPLRAVCGN